MWIRGLLPSCDLTGPRVYLGMLTQHFRSQPFPTVLELSIRCVQVITGRRVAGRNASYLWSY